MIVCGIIRPDREAKRAPGDVSVTVDASRRNISRIVRIISVLSLITVLSLTGYFVIYPGFRDSSAVSAGGSAEKVSQAGESSLPSAPMAVWIDEHTFAFGVFRNELPDMERAGSISVMLFSKYASPLLLQLLESEGTLSGGVLENNDLKEFLTDFLRLHTLMEFVGEERLSDGRELNIYTIQSPELQNNIGSLLRVRELKNEVRSAD